MLKELVSISNILEEATKMTGGIRVALERAMGGDPTVGKGSPVVFAVKIHLPENEKAAPNPSPATTKEEPRYEPR
jgi:hypothetical protein